MSQDNRIKPNILSTNTLLRRNLEASAPPDFQELPPSTERDVKGTNRHLEIKREDTFDNTSISLQDIDEAVKYYLETDLALSVESNGESIKVPVVYGSGERWKSVQADGYYRDKNGKIQVPLIMFKRTSIEKRRELGNKLDGNNPNLYVVEQNKYSAKNAYNTFDIINNTKQPQREIYQIPVPDYLFVNYEAIIWTDFMSQNNKLVEAIEYVSDAYWGNKEKYLFQTNIDSITNINELQVGEDRLVKASCNFKLAGYIIPDTFKKTTQSQQKQFTTSEIVITNEVVKNINDLYD